MFLPQSVCVPSLVLIAQGIFDERVCLCVCAVTFHPASSINCGVPIIDHLACHAMLGLLQQRAVWLADQAPPVCTECNARLIFCIDNLSISLLCLSVSTGCMFHSIFPQIISVNISRHTWHWTVIPSVLLHLRFHFQHAIKTVTAIIMLFHTCQLSAFLQSAVERSQFLMHTDVWNDLPTHVTSALSLAIFRQHLKKFLFSRYYRDIDI